MVNHEIMFFLGAGASVKAGVPTTVKFIDAIKSKDGYEGFQERIETENDKLEIELLNNILENLKEKKKRIKEEYIKLQEDLIENVEKEKKFKRIKQDYERFEKIDVELVLETLNKLNNKDEEILLEFYDKDSFKFLDKEKISALETLERKLRQFIREKTIVDEENIHYLRPLLGFKPLKIFSVNYDTCIEQFSKIYDLKYTDGFELYWHQEFFNEKYDVKHYKIHGSVVWYLTDKETYMKIPIASKKNEKIDLITGETAENLIIYPMESKLLYAEPLMGIIQKLRDELEEMKVCIIIGYSFRDEYIRKIFFESANKNLDLILFLISPSAGEIYNKKLKFVDKDRQIPSAFEIDKRVICFNYPIENFLENLYQTIKSLSEIKSLYKNAYNSRIKGEINYLDDFKKCLIKCAEIGHIKMAEKIIHEEFQNEPINLKYFSQLNNLEKFKLYYQLGIYQIQNRHYSQGKDYFNVLKDMIVESLENGNEIFKLSLEKVKFSNNQEKENEMENKANKLNDSTILGSSWFSRKSDWHIYLKHFTQFLFRQKGFRNGYHINEKDNKIEDCFFTINSNCHFLKNCLEIPFDHSSYKGDKVNVINYGTIEIKRKEDAEKKLKKVIKSLDKLINLCEKLSKKKLNLNKI